MSPIHVIVIAPRSHVISEMGLPLISIIFIYESGHADRPSTGHICSHPLFFDTIDYYCKFSHLWFPNGDSAFVVTDVFISYSRVNNREGFVTRLVDALAALDLDVWVDWEDIPVAENFMNELVAGVDQADNFLCLLSPSYLASQYCLMELERAIQGSKRIIPLLLDGIDFDDLPNEIRFLNAVYFTDPTQFEERFTVLVTAIQTDQANVREHTRILTRAREWETNARERGYLLTGVEINAAENWLASAERKDPRPAPLHVEYILASRAAQRQQQRYLLVGVTIALVVAIALAVLSAVGFRNAGINAATAVAEQARAEQNAATATIAQGAAQFNAATAVAEANARATQQLLAEQNAATATIAQGEAQFNAGTAVAEADARATQQLLAEQNAATAIAAQATSERRADEAQSILLSNSALQLLNNGDPITALALALEANRMDEPLPIAQRTLAEAAYAPNASARYTLPGNDSSGRIYFSPGGQAALVLRSATGGRGSFIYDVAPMRPRVQLDIEMNNFEVSFSPDGQTVVLSVRGGEASAFDVQTGEIVAHLNAATDIGATINSERSTFLFRDRDETLSFRDVATGNTLASRENVPNGTLSPLFSPDGLYALTANYCQERSCVGQIEFHLWNTRVLEESVRFEGHSEPVKTAAFSSDNSYVATGSFIQVNADVGTPSVSTSNFSTLNVTRVGEILLWDVNSGRLLRQLRGHSDEVTALAVAPNSRQLLSGAADGTIILWDVLSGLPLAEFHGHQYRVDSVAFSPDGVTAYSSSSGEVMEWDLRGGQSGGIDQRFRGQTVGLGGVALSPDGKMMVTGDIDGAVLVWDTATGKVERIVSGIGDQQNERGYSVDVSADGNLLVVGNEDGSINLWDTRSGTLLRQIPGEHHRDANILLALDDQSLWATDNWIDLVQYDVETGNERRRVRQAHPSMITSLGQSADGIYLVTSSSDGKIIVWDTATLEPMQTFQTQEVLLWAAAISADSTQVAAGNCTENEEPLWQCSDTEVVVWDVASGDEIARIPTGTGSLYNLAFSADGEHIFALSSYPRYELDEWNIGTGEKVQSYGRADQFVLRDDGTSMLVSFNHDLEIRTHTQQTAMELEERNKVVHMTYSADGHRIYAVTSVGSVLAFDTHGNLLSRYQTAHLNPIRAVAFSGDGSLYVTASKEALLIWDTSTGSLLRSLPSGVTNDVYAIRFGADNHQLIVSSSNTHRIYDWTTGEIIRELPASPLFVFSSDGQQALLFEGLELMLYDVAQGEPLKGFDRGEEYPSSATFHPNGAFFLVGAADGSISLRDIITGEVLQRYVGHSNNVRHLVFNRDGSKFVSSTFNEPVINVWDTSSGQLLRTFAGHDNGVNGLILSPDGERVFSWSLDSTVIMWRMDTLDTLLAWIEENRYVRELSCAEREQYNIIPRCNLE